MSVAAESTASVQSKSPAVLANRITGLLAWAGVFVAATLTIAHFTGKNVPCGPSGGCETVASHETSQWFGIPVAFIGLIGYLLLAGLAIARPLLGKPKWRLLTNLSVAGTLFGFFASVYFMYTSIQIIKATCYWCVASAVIMTASFIVTGWLWSCESPDSDPEKADSIVHIGGFVGAIALTLTVAFAGLKEGELNTVSIGTLTEDQILPIAAKIRGDKNAPVRIIEFADFNCPACRSIAPEMERIYRSAKGKVMWAFRNLPLPKLNGHETSSHAATLAELAAEKGVFWQFFDTAYSAQNTERVKSVDGLKQIALECGLYKDDINNALDRESTAAKGVIADVEMTYSLGINQTPTFLILAKGIEPKAVSGKRLAAVISDEPYKSLLWEK